MHRPGHFSPATPLCASRKPSHFPYNSDGTIPTVVSMRPAGSSPRHRSAGSIDYRNLILLSSPVCELPVTQIPVRLASRSISAKTVLSRGGVDSACLRSLCFNGHVSTSSTTRSLPVKFALIKACSVANKTFILNDIITSHELDILFVTETWLRTGDLSPFTELCPPQWGFLNSPRISGGGLATVFKNIFKCKILPVKNYSSFEVQLFILANCLQTPLLCALVYRSPKATGCFIHDFSDLLSVLAIQSDKMLILGDFNIHVCCPTKPMVN